MSEEEKVKDEIEKQEETKQVNGNTEKEEIIKDEKDDENNDDDEEEDDDDDDESDEEPPVGMLDRPIEILYTKREKRIVERFDPRKQVKKTSAKTEVSIPNGSGIALLEHPRVLKNIGQESGSDLKVIFSVLFGHKRIRLADVKQSLKKWNGWEVKKNSTEHHKLEENAANLTLKNLEWAMVTLDIETEADKKGKKSKEELMDILSEWCLCPEPRKKLPPTKKLSPKPKPSKKEKSSKSSDKNSDKPKRPLSAYFIWMNENRAAIVEEIGTKDVKEVTRTAGERWNALSDDDKKDFEVRSKKLREKYDKEMEKWNLAHPSESKPEAKSDKTKKVAKVKLASKRPTTDSKDSDISKKKKKKKITMPNDKDLVKAIRKILDGADLETITMKQVVQKVYDRYPGVDLISKKSFIKSKVKEIIA